MRGRQVVPTPPKTNAVVTNKPVANGRTTAPVAQQRAVTSTAPRFKQTREGMLVTHREYIADITRNSNAFTVDTFNINSGLASTFPWLAQIAGRFESYTFERLDFVFESMVPTTQAGTVMMAIDFDAADTPPTTKTTIMSYYGAVRSAPWQPSILRTSTVDRTKMVKERYVRTGALTGTYDIKTYDMGNLFVATVGTGTQSVVLGELYVDYTVRFRTPQISTAPGLGLNRRATQTGTITTQAGTIISNIANVVGEGNSALMQATDILLHFDPRLRRFLFQYNYTPETNNWTTTVSSAFANLNEQYANPLEVARQLQRMGRPANAAHIPSVAGTKSTLSETLIFSEADEEYLSATGRPRGQAITSWPLRIRTSALPGNGTLNYTIIPLDNDIWPQTDGIVATATEVSVNDPVIWPTTIDVIPGQRLKLDNINHYTFNVKDSRPVKPDPVGKK